MDLNQIDLSGFNALDYHIWFAHTDKIPGLKEVSSRDQTKDYRKVYAGLQLTGKKIRQSDQLDGWKNNNYFSNCIKK